LDYITFPSDLITEMPKILPFVETNGLNIISKQNLASLLENIFSFEKFLSRKDAKVVLDPCSEYSWQDVLAVLKFSQDMFFTHNSWIDFKDFTFDFHAPFEVRQALLTRFKQGGMKSKRVIFLFKAGSFDWLQEKERNCLDNLINELCKEKNTDKYSEIEFHITFKSAFDKGLEVINMKNNIFSVIRDLTQGQKKANILKRCSLKMGFEGVNVGNLFSFLALFQQIPNTISILKLDLFSKDLKNLTQIIKSWKPTKSTRCERSMIFLKNFYEEVKKFVPRIAKIKGYVNQLKEKNTFMEYVIPQVDEIDELKRLALKYAKKACEDFSVNVDFYLE